MDFGVTITSGVQPWQIFQQKADHTASIHLSGEYHLVHLSQELPLQFERIAPRPSVVKARIALENTGEAVLPWTKAHMIDDCRWEITFPNVPAGGLYRVETTMEYEGWDGLSCTRGDMVHHIGVGDVFVIAGQSNAAGRAKNPVEDVPAPGVHVLRSSGRWDMATHPLGETTGAIYLGHFENHNPGHSPWLRFAKRLKDELAYPIGLVPCAYGGSPLRWWNPDENGALLDNMLSMLNDAQISPKAVLWCQGEAEGFEDSAETYLARFTNFVQETREKLQQPDLPFITVQINRCVEPSTEAIDRQWGLVREAQRQAAHTIANIAVVPSADVAMYDFIHNAAEGNLVIGDRCARAALSLCYGRSIDYMAPEPEEISQIAPDTVRLRFCHIRNWVNPYEVPASALPFDAEDAEGLVSPVTYKTGEDNLTITFARRLLPGAMLHGAWRMNPGIAIPCDCTRLPMLSFYGAPIKITRKDKNHG